MTAEISNREELIAQAIELGKASHFEESHARSVWGIALELFDLLGEVHGLGASERVLLECAAILHDIGYAEGGPKHHKHSRDRILADTTLSLNDSDRAIVALIARYHRRSLPAEGHRYYSDLGEGDRAIVAKLAAFLKIADGFDRDRSGPRAGFSCMIEEGQVTVRPPDGRNADGARKKTDLFEAVFGKKIVIADAGSAKGQRG